MKDGGPAFPHWINGGQYFEPGMSLRDYFAATALQSPVMAHALNDTPKPDGITIGQHVAAIAYAIAQRMLAEREKS